MKHRVIIADFTASFKTFYRNKGTLFFTIAFPVILILLFGAIFSGGGAGTYTLHVKNFDYENGFAIAAMMRNSTMHGIVSNYSNFYDGLYAQLNATEVINVKIISHEEAADEEALWEYIDEKTVKSVLVIPEHYSEHLAIAIVNNDASMADNLTLLLDQSEAQRNGVIISVINQLAGLSNLVLANGSNFIRTEEPINIIQEDFEFIDFFLPGVIALTVMTNSVFGIVETNIRLRKRGILRKLTTTPLTRSEWLLGKMLFMLFTSFLSALVILIVGILVWDIAFNFNAYMLILIVAASFAFAGIGMLLTRFVTDEEAAPAAANAVTFPMMFLSGVFFQLEMMPTFLQAVAKFMPLYYVGEGLRDAMIYNNMEGALFNTLIVVIFAAIVFAVGVAITTWKES
jgi:ABC-2 type transport system permease protein